MVGHYTLNIRVSMSVIGIVRFCNVPLSLGACSQQTHKMFLRPIITIHLLEASMVCEEKNQSDIYQLFN